MASSELREQVNQIMIDALPRRWIDDDYDDGLLITQFLESSTKPILAAVREALLKSGPLAELNRTMVKLQIERAGWEHEGERWPDDYHDLEVIAMMDESRQGMAAALDAAGIGEVE